MYVKKKKVKKFNNTETRRVCTYEYPKWGEEGSLLCD